MPFSPDVSLSDVSSDPIRRIGIVLVLKLGDPLIRRPTIFLLYLADAHRLSATKKAEQNKPDWTSKKFSADLNPPHPARENFRKKMIK